MNNSIATFGAGCFWGVQEAFQRLKGVHTAIAGYSGGNLPNPTYVQVCSGTTGHTEVVQLTYDPEIISYEELLTAFWKMHDSTKVFKTQYRSVIFFHTSEQNVIAKASKPRDAVTPILPAQAFYRAEEYHQDYLKKHSQDH